MQDHLFYAGARRTVVCVCRPNGRSPAKEFLDNLNRERPSEFRGLEARLIFIAEYAGTIDREKFKKLSSTKGLWELRFKDIRLLVSFSAGRCCC